MIITTLRLMTPVKYYFHQWHANIRTLAVYKGTNGGWHSIRGHCCRNNKLHKQYIGIICISRMEPPAEHRTGTTRMRHREEDGRYQHNFRVLTNSQIDKTNHRMSIPRVTNQSESIIVPCCRKEPFLLYLYGHTKHHLITPYTGNSDI